MRLCLLVLLPFLAACEQVSTATDRAAEASLGDPVRTVVRSGVAGRPGVSDAQADRIAQCVLSSARPGELARIAADATSQEGPAPDIALLISQILARPGTAGCVGGAS